MWTNRTTFLNKNNIVSFLVLLLFALVPFQRRFHGYFDSLSRKLTLPDFLLPEYFSTKMHVFVSDFLVIGCVGLILMLFKGAWRTFFWEGPSKYLTLLFFVFLLATKLSIAGSYALQYLRFFEFSLAFLFFHAIRFMQTKIDLAGFVNRLAWLFLWIALCQCVISFIQYFTQDSVGLGFLGERNIKRFNFPSTGKLLWFMGSKSDETLLYRAAGTFFHPNILAGFLFTSIMATCYLVVREARSRLRIFLLAAILVQVFALYLSFSRAAGLALGVSLFVWLFLQIRHSLYSGGVKSQVFRRVALLGITILCSGLIGLGLLYSQLSARGGIVNYNQVSRYADSERVIYMKLAASMVKEHPLLGIGYNNFEIHAHAQQQSFPEHYLYSKVHNIYLLIAAESGLLGGGLFLLFLLSIGRAAWKGLRPSSPHFQTAAFLSSVFLGYLLIGGCDFYFVDSPQGSLPFFGIAALLYSVSNPLDT